MEPYEENTDTDNLCRNLLILSNHDIHRKQILDVATAFLRNTEDPVDEKQVRSVYVRNVF